MEENLASPLVSDGYIRAIKFSTTSYEEICTYSINDCPISHPSQLTNPFLGLPVESGKCESCGTAENGNCEGHFGYIELPVPVYHPSHISELKQVLSLVCLKCMRMKGKVKHNVGEKKGSNPSCEYCLDIPQISFKEVKTTDGACFLEMKVPSRTRLRDGLWNFLDKFGYRYGDTLCRSLLPFEALNILKDIPIETRRRLSAKGYFPQDGYILQYLPVPPNCLIVPEISDGKSCMSADISISLLKRVLNKIELIKRSRSGSPNFESHEVESNDLQSAIAEYMRLRGTTKTPQDMTKRFKVGNETVENTSKQWLEKMRTLFIRKGSGFSSRSVITGDAYIGINEIGLPSEIAKKITFEERVTEHNLNHLQKMVDNGLCVTYTDGRSKFAIAVGSKGHTHLKLGQVIHRRIVDGDLVFINRPPSIHKHSLQALSVYVHEDHTVKINPLICAPLGADFDGDCVHIFYPQSLAAKAEVSELFSVEHQLLSSHSGQLNMQLVNDSLLSLKLLSKTSFMRRAAAQQLSMFANSSLPPPAVITSLRSGPLWTPHQILQSALPPSVNCFGDRHIITQSEILKLDFNKDALQASMMEIIGTVFSKKGPKEALSFFNVLQPLLMETLSLEGFSISLKDFSIPKAITADLRKGVQEISYLLSQLRLNYNEMLELQVENHLKSLKSSIRNIILKSSLGSLIDSKSESAIIKVVQQLGFLGLQLFDRGKLYSRSLVQDIFSHFINKYSADGLDHSSEAYGLVKSSFFRGLNPYEELVHSISSREVIVRSSRGLTEPGTLFKNLMAILRDVVICYDGTVRNVCSNSIVQFEYELVDAASPLSVDSAGEPVGVLAATSISNPSYKAVLDSSQSTNSSWELMKEILLCKVNYRSDVSDRRVILYLKDCCCGKKFCKENAACAVQNCLKKVTLKDCAVDFSIEYHKHIPLPNSSQTATGLIGHIHLNKKHIQRWNRNIDDILRKCQEVVFSHTKKKGNLSHLFRRILLSTSDCCSSKQVDDGNVPEFPCLQFSYCDGNAVQYRGSLEQAVHVMADTICPILLDTIIKGDPRVNAANIIWIGRDATSWVRNSCSTMEGELAIEVIIEKSVARQNGDAWRIALDACLPVMHLVDTRRSIPYGIQQIKELLGISCAFDQSVQRLSSAIRMVSKGLLKEHLILVGNSMTCTGQLIGFNTAGFKALFRSLKVQVPFTEGTLFTPMKGFERAAEKIQTDSLGSIVSACAWGKHVAIGTGSNFQVLWDKRQMADHQEAGKDVYEFLALVRSSSDKDLSSRYLGDDVDDLAEYIDNDLCLSPEDNVGSEKLIFDDSTEAGFMHENNTNSMDWEKSGSGWEKVSGSDGKSDDWQGWGNTAAASMSQTNSNQVSKSSWENVPSPQIKSNGSQEWKNALHPIAESPKLPANSNMANESSWEKVSAVNVKSNDWRGWGNAEHPTVESPKLPSNLNMVGESSWDNVSATQTKSNYRQRWGNAEHPTSSSSKLLTNSNQANQSSWQKSPASTTKPNDWQGRENVGHPTEGASMVPTNLNQVSNSNWDKFPTSDIKSNDRQGWESEPTASSSNVWSSWNAKKEQHPVESPKFSQDFGGYPSGGEREKPKQSIWTTHGVGTPERSPTPKGNKPQSSAGWGSSKGWGSQSDRRAQKRDSNGNFPSTRRRMESFTPEEEKILVDVEPLMLSIRRILRESSDGGRLPDEDQKFIIENVFQYHPDKEAKVSGQIDYIMVNRHASFTDSRCFYVVSSDGSSADFSYFKCMERYIQEKFPEHGQSFCGKYFRRRRAEPSNDDRQPL